MQHATDLSVTDNPLTVDVKEIELSIQQLVKTNEELGEMLRDDDQALSVDDQADIRLLVVENEYAIEAKLQKRSRLLSALNLQPIDEFHLRYAQTERSDWNHSKPGKVAIALSAARNEPDRDDDDGINL